MRPRAKLTTNPADPANRGHTWIQDDGRVDFMALDVEHHNGPMCSVCYHSYCEHCEDGPSQDCEGPQVLHSIPDES